MMDGVRKYSHTRDRQRSHLQATAEQLKKTLADLQVRLQVAQAVVH